MERLRILVLFGGCSSEHEVSLQSAHGVLTHMDPERYCPIPVGITREGAWYVYTGPLDAIPGGRWQREAACVPCTLRLDRGNQALVLLDGSGREVAFDLAFPVLHGRNGEDGTVHKCSAIFAMEHMPLQSAYLQGKSPGYSDIRS